MDPRPEEDVVTALASEIEQASAIMTEKQLEVYELESQIERASASLKEKRLEVHEHASHIKRASARLREKFHSATTNSVTGSGTTDGPTGSNTTDGPTGIGITTATGQTSINREIGATMTTAQRNRIAKRKGAARRGLRNLRKVVFLTERRKKKEDEMKKREIAERKFLDSIRLAAVRCPRHGRAGDMGLVPGYRFDVKLRKKMVQKIIVGDDLHFRYAMIDRNGEITPGKVVLDRGGEPVNFGRHLCANPPTGGNGGGNFTC